MNKEEFFRACKLIAVKQNGGARDPTAFALAGQPLPKLGANAGAAAADAGAGAGYDYSYPVEVSQRGKLFCRNVSNRFGHFTLCLLGMYAVDVDINMLLNPKTPFSY